MKIIHWNCQGGFRKKFEKIYAYNPDILIISECESPSKLQFGKLTPKPTDYFWYGDNLNKGVCFLFFNNVKFSICRDFNSKYRYIIPLQIFHKTWSFNLFGIWAMGNSLKRSERYIGQVWMAINYYESLLAKPTVLFGDFNSNQIWDRKKRVGNHTDVVNKLLDNKIESLYHKQLSVKHGGEPDPTFFLYRNKEKSYHLDYCFCSETLLQNGYHLELGNVDEWLKLSDHLPMIVCLNEK